MSIKKYMLIDLSMLSGIGLILEAVGTYFINYMFVGAYPMTVVSLLITIVALVRWGWKGLLVVPFCALGNFIGGQFLFFHDKGFGVYDWKMLLSVFFGLAALSVNLILFHKFKTNVLLQKYKWFAPVMILADCLIFELVRGIIYAFILRGDNGYIINNSVGYDIMGYGIAFVMGLILLHQKVMLNFEEKIAAEREQILADRKAEEDYLKNAGKKDSLDNDDKE